MPENVQQIDQFEQACENALKQVQVNTKMHRFPLNEYKVHVRVRVRTIHVTVL